MKKVNANPAEKKRIVVIGGGTGMPVLLRGLKELPIDLTALVTVADDGGSTGRLRNEMD
ncbi:MAG TPA: 2-phospho-L-lactate transferase CofD family protein, partial [Pseudogracilibacillus sp.]|nr:2-phospho-L-lactate transferase CofD family protein [Pseudogracilibacillus sp.]